MVIAYHDVVPYPPSYIYSVSVPQIQEHLQIISEFNAHLGKQATPLVTFDDGHISQYEHALPELQKFGVKGAFCVTAGWTGRQATYMSGRHLRELAALGHAIYAHGWSHKMLTRCTPAWLYDELRKPKQFLEDLLGAPVIALSIPHGRWNQRVLEMCGAAGYGTVYHSDSHRPPATQWGVRLVGRRMMTRNTSPDSIRRLLGLEHTPGGLPRMKSVAKTVLRAGMGEERYRRLWRRAGSAVQPLPEISTAERPLRVLHLISSAGFYGAESMLLNLTRSLAAEKCEAVIGVFRNSRNPNTEIAERASQNGVASDIIDCRGRFDRQAVRELQSLLYRRGIDIVHTHGSKANLYGWLAAGRLRMPLVATCHMAWPDRSMMLRAYHSLDRLVLRRFQKLVAVSDAIAGSLRRSGLQAQRIATIANGIDVAPFQATNRKPMSRLFGDQIPVIGLVGRLTPCKGHRYLLQAAHRLLREFPKMKIVFVGDGPELGALQEEAFSNGLMERVIFAGKQIDMPRVYASVDIVVLPSLTEGMPMTVIEALASARPVVASRVGDVPKLIRHGETGLLIEAGNPDQIQRAIRELLLDPSLSQALAERGRQWVTERFSAAHMARCYAEIYRQILKSPAGSGISDFQDGVSGAAADISAPCCSSRSIS